MSTNSIEHLKSKKGIELFLNKATFVQRTCQQINKDLSPFSAYQITTPTHQILKEIINQIIPALLELENNGKLFAFVYRVDLNENLFKAALSDRDFSHLAFQVIQREAQKVFLKEKFKAS